MGGFGQVWDAHDPTVDRLVAVKILTGDGSADHDRQVARFRREAAVAGGLAHGRPYAYLVMQLPPGMSLSAAGNRPTAPAEGPARGVLRCRSPGRRARGWLRKRCTPARSLTGRGQLHRPWSITSVRFLIGGSIREVTRSERRCTSSGVRARVFRSTGHR